MRGRAVAAVAMIVVVAVQLVVGQLGWIRVGSTTRNSYEMFRSAQRLGLDQLTPFRVVWYVVPVVSLAIGIAIVAGRHRIAPGLLLAQSLAIGTAGVVVLRSGVTSAVGAGLAPVVAAVGIVVAGGLLFVRWDE